MLSSNKLSDDEGYYYLEQLDSVPIHLISTHYYDDKEFEKSGIPAVRERLYQILSTSQRFEHSRKILSDRLTIVVQRLRGAFSGRLRKLSLFGSVLRDDFDPARSDVDVLAELLPTARPGWEFFGWPIRSSSPTPPAAVIWKTSPAACARGASGLVLNPDSR